MIMVWASKFVLPFEIGLFLILLASDLDVPSLAQIPL